MIKLIKNARIYSPEDIGPSDVLIVGNKIGAIGKNLTLTMGNNIDFEEINAAGKILVPGFIDGHVHIIGGGGEGGYRTRTPEISLTDITTAGVTTVVGCIGTDGVTRTMEALLAKARGLEEEGISSYIVTGSYRLPVTTITENVMKDMLMIDKVIGVGEIAISDHRSSQPDIQRIKSLAADTRVGGILSGKAGIVVIHIGDGSDMLNSLYEIVDHSELPYSQFLPTHINRSSSLLFEGIKYAKAGGFIDITTSSNSASADEGDVKAGAALKRCIDDGVPIERITFTSDAQGSLPVFNEKNEFVRLGIGKVSSLYNEVRNAVTKNNVPLETAIKVITSNPAHILKLKNKGRIEKGLDADMVLLDESSLEIDTVIAMGQVMVQNKEVKVYGTFEN
jgi:beta-aspartyl-dipeptidase (metallo-type)